MTTFPVTSVTLIAKIRTLGPEQDSTQWVRFWDAYAPAIRQFAVFKGGEENADDVVMQVLARLVEVLRNGQYTPEKGKFHSYLATMIVNEVRMLHRKDEARASDCKVSLDAVTGETDETEGGAIADTLAAPELSPEEIDRDWKQAVLRSAVEHVLTKTALSPRDRDIYRAYAQQGDDIAEVAKRFGITRNYVSQIKTRIDRRIVAYGRELAAQEI